MDEHEPDEPVVKRGRGRPPGTQNKGSEKLGRGKLRDSLADSLTQRDIDKLPPATRANLLSKLEPKEREEGQGTEVRLIVSGLPGWKCFHCGAVQPKGYDPATQTLSKPLDAASGESPPAEPPARATPPVSTSRDKVPYTPARTRYTEVVPEPDPPAPRGAIFTVPRAPGADLPPEWRSPLFPEEEN